MSNLPASCPDKNPKLIQTLGFKHYVSTINYGIGIKYKAQEFEFPAVDLELSFLPIFYFDILYQ